MSETARLILEIFGLIVSAATPLAVGIVLGVFNRKQDKKCAIQDRKNIQHEKENRLNMELTLMLLELCVAISLAIKNGKTNGEMEAALKGARKARADYANLIKDVAAEQINLGGK